MLPIEPIIPITSREYKMMLNSRRFSGDKDAVEAALKAFQNSLQEITTLEVSGHLKFDKKQEVRFWDLPDSWLYKTQNYVLRTRIRKGKTTLTLKCRHGDRYFVQSQAVKADNSKFEEDIKPSFTHLFSYSRKIKSHPPETIKGLVDLFPDLKRHMGEELPTSRIKLVRDFVALEKVHTGLTLHLSNSFNAECAVIIWYDLERDNDKTPAVVEFSFRYPNKIWINNPPPEPSNAFDGVTGLIAHDFYTSLQTSKRFKDKWFDPKSKTKTRVAYEGV